jgi:hypothetical protein
MSIQIPALQNQMILAPKPVTALVGESHDKQQSPPLIPTACFDPQIIKLFGGTEIFDKLPRLISSNYRIRGEPDLEKKKSAIKQMNYNSESPEIAVGRDGWHCPYIRVNFAEKNVPKAPVLFMVIYGVNENGKIKWYLQDEEFSASHPDYELLKRIVSQTDTVYKLVAARFKKTA